MRRIIVAALALVLFFTNLSAQTRHGSIKGTVTTSDGKPVHEVTVFLKELNKHTRTNETGKFEFRNVPQGKYTIAYSFAETGTREVKVTVPPDENASTVYELPLNTKELEEVIITARKSMNNGVTTVGKSNIKIMDLPQAVTVIGQSTIENQQAQRLSDVVKNVNGVYLAGMRAGTQETFYARGYNFSNSNMFKNGFRVNTGAMPEMSGLESVEILKGSAAILYGNVSPGGVLNMVTKKPKFNFGGEVNLRAGSFNLLKPSVDFYGPISKGVAFRINGSFESAKSYRDVVASKRYYVNPSLLFKLGEKTDLLMQGDYLKHRFTPDFGIGTLSDSIIANVPRNRFMGAAWQYTETDQATASAELNHRFNDSWQLNAGLSYQNYQRDYYAIERIQADAAGKWKRPLGKTNNKENYYTGQVNLNGKFNTGGIKHNVLLGMDADKYLTQNLASDITGKIYDSINLLEPAMYVRRTDIPAAKWITRADVPVSRFGAYVQDLVSLSDKLKVLAGIRWSYQQSDPTKTTYLLKNDSLSLGKAQTDKAFSPRVGLVYQPVKNVSLFASYSNSFTPNTGTDIHFNALKPSIIDQYELGIKNDFLDGKLSANLTLYRIINNNLVQMAPFAADGKPNANSGIKELTGQTTSDGLEFDFNVVPVKGLDIIAGYSYNNSRYTRASQASTAYVNGQRLVNTPAHTANATAFYKFCEGSLKGLKLGAGIYYIGERIAGWNYTVGNKRPLFPVKAFTTIDVSAGYSFKKISLMAKVANLTNTYNYYVHENYSINPIAPRNFVATVAYRF